jgi:hypothetical protein
MSLTLLYSRAHLPEAALARSYRQSSTYQYERRRPRGSMLGPSSIKPSLAIPVPIDFLPVM